MKKPDFFSNKYALAKSIKYENTLNDGCQLSGKPNHTQALLMTERVKRVRVS